MAYTTINDPSAYFQTTIYTGNGGTQSITNTGNSDMQPDWTWIKRRDSADNHNTFDSVRGATHRIITNLANAQDTVTNMLTSFNSDGFSVGSHEGVNGSSMTYASWNWKAGTSSGITTTDSTITPAGYSFNQTAGFSIIKYPGNGTDDAKCPHGLGVAPQMIFIKDLDNAADWECYNEFNGNGKVFHLNKTNGADATSARWRNTSPDAVNWTMGSTTAVNGSGRNYVAYCFAGKQGYSKFGSYVANGASGNGTYVHLGFKPAFVIHKQVSTTGDWRSWNNKSSPFNQINNSLFPNTSASEYDTDSVGVDFLSNGIKWRQTDTTNNNPSGGVFIYMAWAESPFVTSGGVPATAR